MASPINKKTIEHLAELARIELTEKEKEGLSADLAKILAHFEELQKLDLSGVEPMAGGTELKNVFRNDPIKPRGDNGADDERENTDKGAGTEAFPEKDGGYLKIPPVFSSDRVPPKA